MWVLQLNFLAVRHPISRTFSNNFSTQTIGKHCRGAGKINNTIKSRRRIISYWISGRMHDIKTSEILRYRGRFYAGNSPFTPPWRLNNDNSRRETYCLNRISLLFARRRRRRRNVDFIFGIFMSVQMSERCFAVRVSFTGSTFGLMSSSTDGIA